MTKKGAARGRQVAQVWGGSAMAGGHRNKIRVPNLHKPQGPAASDLERRALRGSHSWEREARHGPPSVRAGSPIGQSSFGRRRLTGETDHHAQMSF